MEEERAWIEGALAGDQGAFARLVEAYKTPVYNLAYRMLGDAADAEDAAQETFLRAHSRLASYDQSRKFSSWLLSITAHYCIDQLRRRRFTWLALEDLPPWRWVATEATDPEEAALRREEQDQVQEMLARLRPQYCLVITLRYWHDLSYAEIAEVAGISESAVKSRLHRARQMLARELRTSLESGGQPAKSHMEGGQRCAAEKLVS